MNEKYDLWIGGIYQMTGNAIAVTTYIAQFISQFRDMMTFPLQIELTKPGERSHSN